MNSARTISAVYKEGKPKLYQVSFQDHQGRLLWNPQWVEEGKEARAPVNPKREGYTFLGWDQDFCCVTQNLVLSPRYIEGSYQTYPVTYRGIIHNQWKNIRIEYVIEGGDATQEPAPDQKDYRFVNWGAGGSKITKATTLIALYAEIDTIQFMIGNQEVKTVVVDRGERVEFPTLEEVGLEEKRGYTFHWNLPGDYETAKQGSSQCLKKSMKIYGEYQKNYRYTARDFNENVLSTNCYAYALDWLKNPKTGEAFGERESRKKVFAMQPGLLTIEGSDPYKYGEIGFKWYLAEKYINNNSECRNSLISYINEDMQIAGYSFKPFEGGMSGGHRVLLFRIYQTENNVVKGGEKEKVSHFDYHWWRLESDGTWSNKHGHDFIRSSDVGIRVTSKEEVIAVTRNYYAPAWGEGLRVELVGCYYVKEGK